MLSGRWIWPRSREQLKSLPLPPPFLPPNLDVPMLLRNDVAAFFVISIAIVDSGVLFIHELPHLFKIWSNTEQKNSIKTLFVLTGQKITFLSYSWHGELWIVRHWRHSMHTFLFIEKNVIFFTEILVIFSNDIYFSMP